jgi:WD40 repeat protein
MILCCEAMMQYFYLILLFMFLMIPTLAEDDPDIKQVARFGRGTAYTLAWRPDGEVLAIGSATGVWFFDEDFNELGRLAEDTPVDSLEWSPDGTRLITANNLYPYDNCELIIWIVEERRKETIRNDCPTTIDWSSDGTLIAIGTLDIYSEISKVVTLTTENYDEIDIYENVGMYVAFSPDSQQLAISQSGNQTLLTILNLSTGDIFQEINNPEVFGDVEWSYSGEYILTGCNLVDWDFGGSCQLDAKTGKIVQEIEGILRVRWRPYHNDFLSQAINPYGGSAWIFTNFEDYQNLIEDAPAFEFIGDLVWHPSGEYITVFSKKEGIDGVVSNINITQNLFSKEQQLFSFPVKSITWNPENLSLLSTTDSADFVWNWDSRSDAVRVPSVQVTENIGTITQSNTEVRWISQTEFITISLITDYGINFAYDNRIHDARSGDIISTPLYYYSFFKYLTDGGGLPLTSWSTALNQVAYTSFDNRQKVIIADELFTEDETVDFEVSVDRIRQIEWSPDDSMIATAGNISDSHFVIDIWNASSGEKISSIHRSWMKHFSRFVWSPDNSILLVIGERLTGGGAISRTLSLYKVSRDYDQYTTGYDWYEDTSSMNANIMNASWSPDSQMIAVSFQDAVKILDVNSGIVLGEVPIDSINTLDWHENGDYLAGGASDGTIYIWDVSALMED